MIVVQKTIGHGSFYALPNYYIDYYAFGVVVVVVVVVEDDPKTMQVLQVLY